MSSILVALLQMIVFGLLIRGVVRRSREMRGDASRAPRPGSLRLPEMPEGLDLTVREIRDGLRGAVTFRRGDLLVLLGGALIVGAGVVLAFVLAR